MSESRRDLIMDAAVRLIRERGFHATGIDEIGEAAGVTGPAVYNHFASKQAVLATAVDEAMDKMQASLEDALALGGAPRDRLGRMIASYVDAAIEHEALIAIWLQESHNLDAPDVRRLLKRQRDYIGTWVKVLREHRPHLSVPEADTTVNAALNLINTVLHHDSRLDPDDLRRLLGELAGRVLLK